VGKTPPKERKHKKVFNNTGGEEGKKMSRDKKNIVQECLRPKGKKGPREGWGGTGSCL